MSSVTTVEITIAECGTCSSFGAAAVDKTTWCPPSRNITIKGADGASVADIDRLTKYATKALTEDLNRRRSSAEYVDKVRKDQKQRKAREAALEAERVAAEKAKKIAKDQELTRQRESVTRAMAIVERTLKGMPTHDAEEFRSALRQSGFFIWDRFDSYSGTPLAKHLAKAIRRDLSWDSAVPQPTVQAYTAQVKVTSGPYSATYDLPEEVLTYQSKLLAGSYSDSQIW